MSQTSQTIIKLSATNQYSVELVVGEKVLDTIYDSRSVNYCWEGKDFTRPRLKEKFVEIWENSDFKQPDTYEEKVAKLDQNVYPEFPTPRYICGEMPENSFDFLLKYRTHTRQRWARTDRHLHLLARMEGYRQEIDPDFRLLVESEYSDRSIAEWNEEYTKLCQSIAPMLYKKSMMEEAREFYKDIQGSLAKVWEEELGNIKVRYQEKCEELKGRFDLALIKQKLPEELVKVILTEYLIFGSEEKNTKTWVLNVQKKQVYDNGWKTPERLCFKSGNPFREAKQNAWIQVSLPKYKIKAIMVLNKLGKDDLIGWAQRFVKGGDFNTKQSKEKMLETIMADMDEAPESIAKRGYLALIMAEKRIKRGKRVFNYGKDGRTPEEAEAHLLTYRVYQDY